MKTRPPVETHHNKMLKFTFSLVSLTKNPSLFRNRLEIKDKNLFKDTDAASMLILASSMKVLRRRGGGGGEGERREGED